MHIGHEDEGHQVLVICFFSFIATISESIVQVSILLKHIEGREGGREGKRGRDGWRIEWRVMGVDQMGERSMGTCNGEGDK